MFEFAFIMTLDMESLADVNWYHDIHWGSLWQNENKYLWSIGYNIRRAAKDAAYYIYSDEF